MYSAQAGTGAHATSGTPAAADAEGFAPPGAHLPHQAAPGAPTGASAGHQDPPQQRPPTEGPPVPLLRHRRDGILPNVAAALTAQGTTLTGMAARGDTPPDLHPLVRDFLDALPSEQRDRFTGRCAETLLVSRHIHAVEAARSKRAQRRPITLGEARKGLKNATLTARRIREDGDPLHGSFAAPCRACTALAAQFGVRIVDPAAPGS